MARSVSKGELRLPRRTFIGYRHPAALLELDHPAQSRRRFVLGTLRHLGLPRDLEELDLYLGANSTRPPLGNLRTKHTRRHLRPHRPLDISPFDASAPDTKRNV